jgi:hypothetical protein
MVDVVGIERESCVADFECGREIVDECCAG